MEEECSGDVPVYCSRFASVLRKDQADKCDKNYSRFIIVGVNHLVSYKIMGLSLNGSPLGFAICYEIITEDQQQQVLYQLHFLRI